MDKVYLLLRNNEQTGPYTIDELLQQKLLPTDMLWIEGRSTAWSYLSELELLPSVKEAASDASPAPSFLDGADRTEMVPVAKEKMVVPKRSYTPDEIERKAEELRKRALNYALHKPYQKQTTPIIERYAHTPISREDESINVIVHRQERNLPATELLTGVLVVGFVAACVIGGRTLLLSQKNAQPEIAAKVLATDEHAAKAPRPSSVVSTASFAAAQNIAQPDSTLIQKKERVNIKKAKLVDSNATPRITTSDASAVSTNNSEKKAEEETLPPIVKTPEEIVVKEESKKELTSEQPKEANPSTVTPEKKKGFLKGIFKKKKKDDKSETTEQQENN